LVVASTKKDFGLNALKVNLN
jgi:hypothetical protein